MRPLRALTQSSTLADLGNDLKERPPLPIRTLPTAWFRRSTGLGVSCGLARSVAAGAQQATDLQPPEGGDERDEEQRGEHDPHPALRPPQRRGLGEQLPS